MTTTAGQISPAAASAWAPFRHPAFAVLWTATVIANIGTWMYNAASGWLMTSLDPDPLTVSLVQAATTLPMFLFAVPAGALADIFDKRRFLIAIEIAATAISAIYAMLVVLDLATPGNLLLFSFLIGAAGALTAPPWQSVVPQLVIKENLSAAVAANSVGINVSRAVGPALAGLAIGSLGIAAPFWSTPSAILPSSEHCCGGMGRPNPRGACRPSALAARSARDFATRDITHTCAPP
jgi:MFS family permease